MARSRGKKIWIVLLYAFIGWAVCASIMGAGMAHLPMHTALILHAIGGPLAFVLLSYHYHRHFRFTEPLQTALIFVSFLALVDFFLVALVILKSLPGRCWIIVVFHPNYKRGRV